MTMAVDTMTTATIGGGHGKKERNPRYDEIQDEDQKGESFSFKGRKGRKRPVRQKGKVDDVKI